MTIYFLLLKALLNYTVYKKYINYVDLKFIDTNYPELSKLFKCLPFIHKDNKEQTYTVNDLHVVLLTEYPKVDEKLFVKLLTDINNTEGDLSKVEDYLEELRKRSLSLELAKKALQASEGMLSYQDLSQPVEELLGPSRVISNQSKYVTDSLQELYDSTISKPGLRWRLNSLNLRLGSLRKGDFGFIFARPETGKTTFLASEVTYFATQTDRPILWFNNEEQGEKVKTRCFQAALGLTSEQLYGNISGNDEKYHQLVGDRIRVYNEASISKFDVEAECSSLSPSLILFDQLDKIKGFSADRNDLELKEVYGWSRELAKLYAPTIGICQAGASGEDKRYLTMNDVDSSKTAKQGEADWVLGIGKIHDQGSELVRFMCLSKNKLQGDKDTVSSDRHGKWSCMIKPEVARYKDFDNKGSDRDD